ARAHSFHQHIGCGGDGRCRGRHYERGRTGRGWLRRICERSARPGAREGQYVGEAVAAVAAEDPLIARRALGAIKVVYETLPAVFDPDEAMRPGAPVLHDYAPDNVTKHIPIRVGDVGDGFAESDLVVEEIYSTQPIEHAYLEPEAGLAYVDHDGVVTIVSPDQNVTHHRHMLARIIAKPISKVRFIMSPVGGGFGGKA